MGILNDKEEETMSILHWKFSDLETIAAGGDERKREVLQLAEKLLPPYAVQKAKKYIESIQNKFDVYKAEGKIRRDRFFLYPLKEHKEYNMFINALSISKTLKEKSPEIARRELDYLLEDISSMTELKILGKYLIANEGLLSDSIDDAIYKKMLSFCKNREDAKENHKWFWSVKEAKDNERKTKRSTKKGNNLEALFSGDAAENVVTNQKLGSADALFNPNSTAGKGKQMGSQKNTD